MRNSDGAGFGMKKQQNQQLEKRRPSLRRVWTFVVVTAALLVYFQTFLTLHSSMRSIQEPLILDTSNPTIAGNRTTVNQTSQNITVNLPQTASSLLGNTTHQTPQHSKQKNKADSNAGEENLTTAAYAVSVTGCGEDPIINPAAVLKHSIHRTSSRGSLGGRYDYDMYAIYHPDAKDCAAPLESLGYKLLQRETFVKVEDIQGDYLREKIGSNGCCGEKELIKFEAYTLTDYPIVVHLDLDVLVLQPMDDIFDMMMLGKDAARPSKAIMWPEKPLPKQINAFYTYDYNMISPGSKYMPIQGGFLVIRPSLAAYEEYKEIVRVGDFQPFGGWGGITGIFWGSMTFQGLVPYYYDVLHPGQRVELSRCIYNQMSDEPMAAVWTMNETMEIKCLTGQEECEDCRKRPIEDIVSAHFTICLKPWACVPYVISPLCRKLTHEWYKVRSELEQTWGRPGRGNSSWQKEQFFGYCNHAGAAGYRRIGAPYGKPLQMGLQEAA